MTIALFLMLLALVCFVLATFNVPVKFNLVAAGLAFSLLSFAPFW